MIRWGLVALLAAAGSMWSGPAHACTPAPVCTELEPLFPRANAVDVALDSPLFFESHRIDCDRYPYEPVVPKLFRADGSEHALRRIGDVFAPVSGLDQSTHYEVVLTTSSSTRSSHGFTTGAERRMRLPLLDRIALDLRIEEFEGREGGICTTEIPATVSVVAAVQVEFEEPVDALFVIDVGFAQTATGAHGAFYPVDAADYLMTARQTFLAFGEDPFNSSIILGELKKWRGPEICATARMRRFMPTWGCDYLLDSCLEPVDQITTCAPKPSPPTGCTAAGTTADSWVLLGLLALLARVRRR